MPAAIATAAGRRAMSMKQKRLAYARLRRAKRETARLERRPNSQDAGERSTGDDANASEAPRSTGDHARKAAALARAARAQARAEWEAAQAAAAEDDAAREEERDDDGDLARQAAALAQEARERARAEWEAARAGGGDGATGDAPPPSAPRGDRRAAPEKSDAPSAAEGVPLYDAGVGEPTRGRRGPEPGRQLRGRSETLSPRHGRPPKYPGPRGRTETKQEAARETAPAAPETSAEGVSPSVALPASSASDAMPVISTKTESESSQGGHSSRTAGSGSTAHALSGGFRMPSQPERSQEKIPHGDQDEYMERLYERWDTPPDNRPMPTASKGEVARHSDGLPVALASGATPTPCSDKRRYQREHRPSAALRQMLITVKRQRSASEETISTEETSVSEETEEDTFVLFRLCLACDALFTNEDNSLCAGEDAITITDEKTWNSA